MPSARRPVSKWTKLWTVSVWSSALGADPASGVFRKPTTPAASRTRPTRAIQPWARFAVRMSSTSTGSAPGANPPVGWADRSSASCHAFAAAVGPDESAEPPTGHPRFGVGLAPRIAPMPAGFTSAKFVGRESAFARIAPALESAAAGVPTTVLVEGTGGVGASRFLTEATSRLAALAEPFTVLRGRSVPAGTDEPYAPILRAIRPTLLAASDAELVELLGPGIEDGLRLVPELYTRLARAGALPDGPTVTSPERRQARLLEGILGVLIRLGERQPVVLMLEDLHHADAGTRAFATFLARVQRPRRVCLVATYQPDAVTRSHPLTEELATMLAARRPPDRLPLEPLDRVELADLIEAIEGERPTGSALVLVAERSRGIPLVAEEVLAARRELSRSSLPVSLEDLVIARLTLRSPECRRVLRLLAPAARPLTTAELADVAAAYERTTDHRPPPRSTSLPRRGDGPIDADLTAGLAEATDHGILETTDEGVDFRHELVGRAVVADLLPGQRHRHHLALASGLFAHPAAAAYHWNEAHATSQAREAAIAAAGRAEAVYAPQDALDHLELALSSIGPIA